MRKRKSTYNNNRPTEPRKRLSAFEEQSIASRRMQRDDQSVANPLPPSIAPAATRTDMGSSASAKRSTRSTHAPDVASTPYEPNQTAGKCGIIIIISGKTTPPSSSMDWFEKPKKLNAVAPVYSGSVDICWSIATGDDASNHRLDGKNLYSVDKAGSAKWPACGQQIIEIGIKCSDFESRNIVIFIWALPWGVATFRKGSSGLATGRAKLDAKEASYVGKAKLGTLYEHECHFEVEIIDSPLMYTIRMMRENVDIPAVQKMHQLNAEARADGEFIEILKQGKNLADWKKSMLSSAATIDMAHLYIKARSIMITLGAPVEDSWWVAGVAKVGSATHDYGSEAGRFDLKPRLSSLWGEIHRMSNDAKPYYYDFWSNFHYGFVGAAAGFTGNELNDIADLDPRGDSKADKAATAAGATFYNSEFKANGSDLSDKFAMAYIKGILEGLDQEMFLAPSKGK